MHIKRIVSRGKCPVEIGDRFYKDLPNLTVPNRLVVVDIQEGEDDYIITGRYMYHMIGPQERKYSSKIFTEEKWKIEKKGVDFEASL